MNFRAWSNLRSLLSIVALASALSCSSDDTVSGDVCSSPLGDCEGVCVALDNDPANCGACGNTCTGEEVCSAGACTFACTGGASDCSGSCVDLDNDPANCGACGTACTGEEVCSAGTCTFSCVGGTSDCSGVCVDLQVDDANCGACGTSCGFQEACDAGTCVSTCGNGSVDADETCDPTAGEDCTSFGFSNAGTVECNATCDAYLSLTCANVCGDSSVEPGESCDEGGVDTATCDAICTLPACGDGYLNTAAGEYLDDGAVYGLTGPAIASQAAVGDITPGAGYGSVLEVTDLDNDGDLDLIVGDPAAVSGSFGTVGAVFVHYNDGVGNFTPAASALATSVAGADFGRALALGDLNGDTFVDLVVGARGYSNGEVEEGAVFVYLNDGAGTLVFSELWESNVNSFREGEAVALIDANNDGALDLASGAPGALGGAVALYPNNGDGTFNFAGPLDGLSVFGGDITPAGNWDYGATLHVTDLGDNGVDDLLIGAPLYTNGQSEEGAIHIVFGGATGISSASLQEVIESNLANANLGAVIESGQLSDDTKRDVVSTFNTGVLDQPVVYADTGAGFAGGLTSLNAGGSVIEFVAIGDVNGDGTDDLLGANPGEGGLTLPAGVLTLIAQSASAPGTFESPFSFEGPDASTLGFDVAVADLDGDNTAEILASTPQIFTTEPPAVWGLELCL